MITMPGSRSVRYEPWTGMRESQKTPPAASSVPATMIGSGADAGEQLGGDPGGHADAEATRKVGQAGLDRRVAEDVLHVEGEEEEHRDEAGDGDQLGDVGGGRALDPEDRERQERVAAAPLVDHEATSSAAAPASSPMVRAEPQPTSGALTSA